MITKTALGALALGLLLTGCAAPEESASPGGGSVDVPVTSAAPSTPPSIAAAPPAASPAAPPPAPAAPAAPKLSSGAEQAVRSAETYLELTGFSRSGLIDQLVIGNSYSKADATAAVDSLKIDYNEQAAKSAQSYIDLSGFSRAGLIEQLVVGSGYTKAQAAAGADAVL